MIYEHICQDCGRTVRTSKRIFVCACRTSAKATSHWITLHQYAVDHADDWQPANAKPWFSNWLARAPRYGCNCPENFAEYLKTTPTMFNGAKEFFEWGVIAHNHVSEHHANNPVITLDDAYASYFKQPPLRRDRLVITVATGREFNKLLALTRPAIEAYAESCDADFVALINETEPWWGFEKFRVKSFVDQYEQTLFLDADAIPWPDAPNIFDMVPIGDVGIHDDWPDLNEYTDWLIGDRKQVYESQGFSFDNHLTEVCLNTGVVVCDPSNSFIWDRPTDSLPRDHTSEQTCVEYRCFSTPVINLPTSMNTQWWMPKFNDYLPSAHIVHFANCKSRLLTVAKHMEEWHEKHRNSRLS